MDIPSGEDAWGEFKSTTEQGDGVLPTIAGSASDCERDEPPPSVANKQQQQPQPEAAEEQESAADGGKEEKHASAETAASAQPSMPHSAAELGEESINMMQMMVVDGKAARSPEHEKQQPQQQQPQCRDDDDDSGSRLDLLDLLPSPTASGNSVSTAGENLDMFGSMLPSAPENPIHKHSAAAAVPAEVSHQVDPADPNDGFRGACAEGKAEWGVFEQPEAEERDPIPTPATPATPATPTLAAEKVDGEWIDLVGPGPDQPGEGKEGHAAAAGDEQDGDGGTAAVGREEQAPRQQQQQQQHERADESVAGAFGHDNEGDDLFVPFIESDASGSATEVVIAEASPSDDEEEPDVAPDEEEDDDGEPHPSHRGAEDDMDSPSAGPGGEAPPEADSDTHTQHEPESWAAATTPHAAGSGSLDDIADFPAATATAMAGEGDVPGASAGEPVAVSAAKPSELEPSLPSGTVEGTLGGERGEGDVAGAGDGSPSAAPEAAGVAPADILVWDDFGAPRSASADEATVDGAIAATSQRADGNVLGGQAKEDKEPSRSSAPDVTAVNVLDWGDFGGPTSASAVEVTVDSAAATSCESADVFEQEGQAKGDGPGPLAAPDEAGVAAADALDWGDFGASTSAVEATAVDDAAAAPSERVDGDERVGQAKEEEVLGEGEDDDEWSAFEAPPTPSAAQNQETLEPPPRTPAVEWGGFGKEDPSGPSSEEPQAGRADVDKTPPRDDEQALPAARPELGGVAGEGGSSSWGAFDEAPLEAAVAPPDDVATEGGEVVSASAAGGAPAEQAEAQATEESAASAPTSAAAPKEKNTQAAAEGVAADEAEAPSAAKEAEVQAIEADEGTGGGDQGQESEEGEDDWGSDFGDFEEAPTTDEPEPVACTASAAAPTGGAIALPKPPLSAARSLPPVGADVGVGGAAAAAVSGEASGGTAGKTSGDARVSVDGGARASPLAAMMAVFDGAFGEATVAAMSGEMIASRRGPPASGGAGEGGSSLDSLADLAHLLAHAKLSGRRAPARLSKWARSCILRGIRPVPDALALQEDGEPYQSTGRRGRSHASVGLLAQQPSTPAAPSPRASPAVEAPRPAAASERPASSSPLASSAGLARSLNAKTYPHAVSPLSAPRPLSRKASATVERSPPPPPPPSRTGAVASPPAVLGQSASVQTTAPRVVSPSRSPPLLPRKMFPTIESPPTEPVVGQQPPPADARSGMGKDATAVGGQPGLKAKATVDTTTTTTTPAVVESEGTRGFATFPASPKQPAGEEAAFEEDEFVWSEAAAITPEMPRHPPPRVPTTPPGVGGGSRGFDEKESGSFGVTASTSGRRRRRRRGDDDDWSNDPFDSFQSAPPASSPAPAPPPSSALEGPSTTTAATAAAAERTSLPSPPAEASPWNLDFLMATSATGGAGGGHVSPALSTGFGAGVSSAGEAGQSGKPLDLVSQALAGFGIAAGAAPDTSHEKEKDFFSVFSEGRGGATGGSSGGGDGGLKGERDRVSSVDVSDLLRATRLRGGRRRASRPAEKLSAAAEARLSALPDLSFMLSQRIRFPMRVAAPLPATATGEGIL
eukprot:g13347.t1